jgi:Bacterial Ig domain
VGCLSRWTLRPAVFAAIRRFRAPGRLVFALVFALVAPLTATATDSDGTVARVEFFNGTTRLGGDTTAPYSIQWNVGAAGAYTITARATDNAGATGTSGPVAVTVDEKR